MSTGSSSSNQRVKRFLTATFPVVRGNRHGFGDLENRGCISSLGGWGMAAVAMMASTCRVLEAGRFLSASPETGLSHSVAG